MSAPNLKEIEWAIQELEKGESSFPVYAKLANLYTVRNEMLGLSAAQPQIAAYSGTAGPVSGQEVLGQYGDSEFLRACLKSFDKRGQEADNRGKTGGG